MEMSMEARSSARTVAGQGRNTHGGARGGGDDEGCNAARLAVVEEGLEEGSLLHCTIYAKITPTNNDNY